MNSFIVLHRCIANIKRGSEIILNTVRQSVHECMVTDLIPSKQIMFGSAGGSGMGLLGWFLD